MYRYTERNPNTSLSFFLFLFFSTKSYGSHIHRSYKNESHKGSYEGNVDGEEKKDISKEDVGYELGTV